MPDSPNPDGPHEHLFWAHHLERARYLAALWPPQPAVVIVCVLCGTGDTLDAGAPGPAPPAGRGGGRPAP